MDTAEIPLSRRDAAKALGGVSLATVDRAISDGELIATRIGRRVLIQPQHIRDFLERNVNNHTARDEMDHAALTVLAAVKKNVIDNDPEAMLTTLRGSSRQVSLRLAEAANIIAHMCKLSDRPEATLAGLVAAVRNAD